MGEIERLVERIEAGENDWQLRAEIMQALFPEWAQIGSPYLAEHCAGEEPIYWHAPEPYRKQPVPEMLDSIDAAVALAEQVLPGWSVVLSWSPYSDECQATVMWSRMDYKEARSSLKAHNRRAAALVLAILRAKRGE